MCNSSLACLYNLEIILSRLRFCSVLQYSWYCKSSPLVAWHVVCVVADENVEQPGQFLW